MVTANRDNKNRRNLRLENQLRILSLIRKNPFYINEIAKYTGISIVACSTIIDELIKKKIVISKKGKRRKSKGRIPELISVNKDYGITCVVDLSRKDIKITMVDLSDAIVCERIVPNALFIEQKHINEVASLIKEMLKSPEVNNRPLLGICIASPGMIKQDTGEYFNAYRIQNFRNINLQTYFSNLFGVETSIYNDIKLACIAEKKAGTIPSNINDVLYIHIGETSGTAMMINGKIYNGANGFSGEISIYNNVDELSSTTRTNKLYSLWRTKSRILEAKKSNETLNDGDELDINEIVQDYLRGDKETAEIIEESAKYNAISIIGYADLLDVEYVVVGGDITKFGENYRELLLHYVNLYDAREFRPRLVFSSLGEDACLKGAIYQVNNNFFVNLFKKMSKLEMDSLELSESSVLNQ